MLRLQNFVTRQESHVVEVMTVLMAWQIEEMDADYDPDFLRHIYPRLEWPALREAAQVMGEPLSGHT